MVQVVVATEDRFGVLGRDDEWTRLTTVVDALRFLDWPLTTPPWTPPPAG